MRTYGLHESSEIMQTVDSVIEMNELYSVVQRRVVPPDVFVRLVGSESLAVEFGGGGCPQTLGGVQAPGVVVPIGGTVGLPMAVDVIGELLALSAHDLHDEVAHHAVDAVALVPAEHFVHHLDRPEAAPVAVELGGGTLPVGKLYHDAVAHGGSPPSVCMMDVIPGGWWSGEKKTQV